MARIVDWNSSPKAISASAIVTFTSSDIPSSQVVAYHLTMTGAGNNLGKISRIRVKANGVSFYDFGIPFYRAFIQAQTGGDMHYPAAQAITNLGTAGTAADWQRFSIPFCFLGLGRNFDAADACQFPVGSNVTIEVTFTAGAVAGNLTCGWTETTIHPRCWPKILCSQMNIGTSQATGRYAFAEDAIIRAFGVNSVGNLRTKMVIDGKQVYHAMGQTGTGSTSVTEETMLLETETLWSGPSYSLQAGTVAVDNSIEDPVWVNVHSPDPENGGTPGRTYVEIQTAGPGVWAGTANELGIYAVSKYQS